VLDVRPHEVKLAREVELARERERLRLAPTELARLPGN